jgi:hypothetical protein
MLRVNGLLESERRPGLLFCRPELVGFYKSASWLPVEGSTEFDGTDILAMMYNAPGVFEFSYAGKLF